MKTKYVICSIAFVFVSILCMGLVLADSSSGSGSLGSSSTSFSSTQPSFAPDCVDTDSGRNYEKQGKVSGILGGSKTLVISGAEYRVGQYATLVDSCSGSSITEYYCTDNQIQYITRVCDQGCSNGACVIKPVEKPIPNPIPQPLPKPINECTISINSDGCNIKVCTDGTSSTSSIVDCPLKRVYLNQKFELSENQAATVVDYKDMNIFLRYIIYPKCNDQFCADVIPSILIDVTVAGSKTSISLSEGEGQDINDVSIRLLSLSGQKAVLLVSGKGNDIKEVKLDEKFSLSIKQSAKIINYDNLIMRVSDIFYSSCNNNYCVDILPSVTLEVTYKESSVEKINIPLNSAKEIFGVKISLLGLSSNDATFVVSRASQSDLQVKLDQKFSLNEQQVAQVVNYRNLRITLNKIRDYGVIQCITTPCPKGFADITVEIPGCTLEKTISIDSSSTSSTSSTNSASAITGRVAGKISSSESLQGVAPECTSQGTHLTLSDGQSAEVFGVQLSLLDLEKTKGTFVVQQNSEQHVQVMISPDQQEGKTGEMISYILKITDNHPIPFCTSGICSSPSYTYLLNVNSLPFRNNLPQSVNLQAGESTKIEFIVYTGSRVDINNGKDGKVVANQDTSGTQLKELYVFYVKISEKLNPLNQDEVKASLLLSSSQNEGGVEISLRPEEQKILMGDKALFQVTVVDKHPIMACITDFVPCDQEKHEYKISVSDIPFAADYPIQLTLLSGETQKFELVLKSESTNKIGSYPFKVVVQEIDTDNVDVVRGIVTLISITTVDTPLPPIPVLPEDGISTPIALKTGWNLISIPGWYAGFDPNDCISKQKLLGFIYLKDQNKYVTLQEAQTFLGDAFTHYISTHAVWIYAYESCTLIAKTSGDTQATDIAPYSGWNLIPMTSDMVGKTLSDIAVSCVIQTAFVFDAENQAWVAVDMYAPLQQKTLGIVIKSQNECTFATTAIVPPSMPE